MDSHENLNENEELLNSILSENTESPEEVPEMRLPTRRAKKKPNVKRIVLICLAVFLSLILIVLVAGVLYVDYIFGRLTDGTDGFHSGDPGWSDTWWVGGDDTDPWGTTDPWDTTDPWATTDPFGTTNGTQIPGSTSTGGIVIPTDPSTTSPTHKPTTLPTTSITLPMTSVPPIQTNVKNIMLLGADKSGKRTDTMMLCTINTVKKTITLTSFMRDTLVTVPGKTNLYKLNAAYAMGGLSMLEETIMYNFGVEIDDFVLVRMDKFPELIDMLGGVDISLSTDEAKYMNRIYGSTMEKGVNHLNGKQALTYSRIRKIDSDHQRVGRQQKVLQALFNVYKEKNIFQLNAILLDVLDANLLSMTMSKNELWNYAGDMFKIIGKMEIIRKKVPDYYYRIDIDGDGTKEMMYKDGTYKGQSVLIPNLDICRKYLDEILNP